MMNGIHVLVNSGLQCNIKTKVLLFIENIIDEANHSLHRMWIQPIMCIHASAFWRFNFKLWMPCFNWNLIFIGQVPIKVFLCTTILYVLTMYKETCIISILLSSPSDYHFLWNIVEETTSFSGKEEKRE